MGRRKDNGADLRSLKSQLAHGHEEAVRIHLASVTTGAELIAIREQKLLLKIRDATTQMSACESFAAASQHLFASREERNAACNYARFVPLVRHQCEVLAARVEACLMGLPRLSLDELIELTQEGMEEASSRALTEHSAAIAKLRDLSATPLELSGLCERALHGLNGRTNDILWAAQRALNEAAKRVEVGKSCRSGRSVRQAGALIMKDLFWLGSVWNGLDFCVDAVSYGEWNVASVETTPTPIVRFDIADLARWTARTVGLRRHIVNLYKNRPPRTLMGDALAKNVDHILNAGLEFYLSRSYTQSFKCTKQDLDGLRQRLMNLLKLVDVEDDFVLLAGAKNHASIEVSIEYLVAVSLRWLQHIADFVQTHVSKREARQWRVPTIPTHLIATLFGNGSSEAAMIENAIRRQVCALPTRRHFDISQMPFVLDSAGQVRGLAFDGSVWTAHVRSQFVRGGSAGANYGTVCEMFIASALRNKGWEVLSGIKIRRSGCVVTDADILAAKEGLLLIAQVKACVGSQANMYDHWRNRLIIEEGARQARAVVDELERNPRLIASFSPIAAFRQARRLQPLVVTTLDSFVGWKPSNVPVLSLRSFLHILRGANVVFRRPDGRVEASHAFSSGTNPTPEEFLRLLEKPVEWQLANETPRQHHTWFDSEGVRWGIPDLIDSPPAGEGQISPPPAAEATATS